ncbi:unnamed protein product [Trichogramma brassicae]|uniref:Uncharacterized protein n=1 Tax=Trichogramma brassicae TaxID=86971 RepID=A0A6H5IZ10_9HYME|nr:unnamed protein product [Trichogramma brassicae]
MMMMMMLIRETGVEDEVDLDRLRTVGRAHSAQRLADPACCAFARQRRGSSGSIDVFMAMMPRGPVSSDDRAARTASRRGRSPPAPRSPRTTKSTMSEVNANRILHRDPPWSRTSELDGIDQCMIRARHGGGSIPQTLTASYVSPSPTGNKRVRRAKGTRPPSGWHDPVEADRQELLLQPTRILGFGVVRSGRPTVAQLPRNANKRFSPRHTVLELEQLVGIQPRSPKMYDDQANVSSPPLLATAQW